VIAKAPEFNWNSIVETLANSLFGYLSNKHECRGSNSVKVSKYLEFLAREPLGGQAVDGHRTSPDGNDLSWK